MHAVPWCVFPPVPVLPDVPLLGRGRHAGRHLANPADPYYDNLQVSLVTTATSKPTANPAAQESQD